MCNVVECPLEMPYLDLNGDGDVVKESVRLPLHPPLLHLNVYGRLVAVHRDAAARRPDGTAELLVVIEDFVLAARDLLQEDRPLQRVPGHVHEEAVRPEGPSTYDVHAYGMKGEFEDRGRGSKNLIMFEDGCHM